VPIFDEVEFSPNTGIWILRVANGQKEIGTAVFKLLAFSAGANDLAGFFEHSQLAVLHGSMDHRSEDSAEGIHAA